jgi:RNA polymerase sigma-70 factor, ECF subfamily
MRSRERASALPSPAGIGWVFAGLTKHALGRRRSGAGPPDAPKDPRTGSFAGTLAPLSFDERGGVPDELLEGYLGRSPRCELRVYRGSWLLLFWYEHEQGPLVRTLMTIETEDERIARVRNYFFTPDVIAEVCAELGVPYAVNGYRYWPDGG